MASSNSRIFHIKKSNYITIVLIVLPVISCNFITIKFKGTGEEQPFMNPSEERYFQGNITIDNVSISSSNYKYKFPNKIVTIKIYLDPNIKSFQKMFSNISNIIEVDISKSNTSLVENMTYMFDNCTSMVFANLSNINISSLINIENMFSNCLNLKYLDLTNVNLLKVPNHRDVFFNCLQLKEKKLLDKEQFLIFQTNKRVLEENSDLIDNDEGINNCDIYNIFNEARDCTIDSISAYQEIIIGLGTKDEYRAFLINNCLNDKNEMSTREGNEIFSLNRIECEETLDLQNYIGKIISFGFFSANLIIFKYIVVEEYFKIPIIYFLLFDEYNLYYFSSASNISIYYNLPVDINEDELYKYNPLSEYYADNCSYIGNLSLYERKKEYNNKNLSLCQVNCTFISYDYDKKQVKCECLLLYSSYVFGNLKKEDIMIHKFELKDEEKNKCIIQTDGNDSNIDNICDIYEYFIVNRTCKIHLATANKDIISGLNDSFYREFLINNTLQFNNEISTTEGNERFVITLLNNEKTIQLGSCQSRLRNAYNISEKENIFIYKHETYLPIINIPIITFEIFNQKLHFSMDNCQTILIGLNIPININEEELYKYNPLDEYYSDNCSYIGDLSLYERKQDYNEKNYSLCQTNCKYDSYNNNTKSVTCLCSLNHSDLNEGEYFDKFELKEEDKYKCKINIVNDLNTSNIFEEMINKIVSNRKGTEKGLIFDDMIKGITNGSLDQLISQIINDKKDFVTTIDGDTYHLTTIKQQFESEELSAVDLGACEDKLRSEHGLGDQELLIFKVDHHVPSFQIPIIEYVLFTENGRVNINLEICKDIPINYLIPVNISGDQLYLYDPNNQFYNDKCNQYTSEAGTDLTIFDRKNEYNIQNMSLCENGCTFEGYNSTTKKTKCTCPIKIERNYFEIDQEKLLNKFKNYKDVINIEIMKCFKLVFSSKGIKKNIGSYVIISIAAINSILITVFYTKGFANLKNTMKEVLNKSFKEKKKNFPPKKQKINKSKRKNIPTKNFDSINNLNDNTTVHKLNKNSIKENISFKKQKKVREKGEKFEKEREKETEKEKKEDEIIYMNDYELNSLSYDEALNFDKRTYWQYYLSLLKTKQLIIFTFYTKTDYNSHLLKIILFLISFALFYTVNALFFNDSTMHQIHEDKGAFNFIYQIPQILYSTLISTAIKTIVTFLSLTEKNLVEIKKKKTKKLALKELDNTLKKIAKKCIAFFVLSFIFVGLFWYYLACFCAVYKNTQSHLTKDTLISFATSLLYPFVFNIFPGLLRIPSLAYKKKCLYIISTFVAII